MNLDIIKLILRSRVVPSDNRKNCTTRGGQKQSVDRIAGITIAAM